MDDGYALQDSGPELCRLLADLLPIGVVLEDEARRCRFANARACELLGVTDESALRPKWPGLRARLALDALPEQPAGAPLRRSVDVETDSGVRRLRLEAHVLPAAVAVLLRDRAAVGAADRPAMLATRAQVMRVVLSGLAHRASGPLNNFHLTLALLDAGVERLDANPAATPESARFRRHLAVLRSEAAKLGDCLAELRALTDRAPASPSRLDLAQAVQDVARVLHHEATIRDATIDAPPMQPAWVMADREAIGLALMALASRLLDSCRPGGVLRLSVASANERRCVVQIACAPAKIDAALADDLFAIGAATARHSAAATARMIVEAHGGVLTLARNAADQCTVLMTLPGA